MTSSSGAPAPRTNGEYIQLGVDAAKAHLAALAAYARAHPDEVAVFAVPYVAVIAATARHRLSVPERLIIAQAAWWLGVLTMKEYRAWKTQPAGPPPAPRLRKVI